MKKSICILLLMCLLTACGGEKPMETVQDVYTPLNDTPMQVELTLPADATVQTLSSDAGKLYLCDSFTVMVQTLPGGALSRTLRDTTGYAQDRLTLIETEKAGVTCYRLSWATVGEGGDQAARTIILDDGKFHYAITVMASAEKAGDLKDTWQRIFSSVKLSTGS